MVLQVQGNMQPGTTTPASSLTVPQAAPSTMPGMPTMGQLYGQVEQSLQGYGNAQQAALQQSYQNALGLGKQSLASSGLAGTSIAPSMAEGYMKQYQLALNNLNQQLTQTQLGAQSQFGMGGLQLGQGQQQISNQFALGAGQLGVSQGQLGVAQGGLQVSRQNANTNQGYLGLAGQQQGYQQQAQQQAGGYDQGYNWQPAGFQAGGGAGSYSDLFA